MATVTVRTGIDEGMQECSFQNATLQGSGKVAYSIATWVKVPPDVVAGGQDAVAAYLRGLLTGAPAEATFDIEVGEAHEDWA